MANRTKENRSSFYARALNEAEKLDFEGAGGVEGLDDEISILRFKIKNILEKDPQNIQLIMACTDMLARLVKTRYSMNREQKKGLTEAINNVIRDIVLPLGIQVINKKL